MIEHYLVELWQVLTDLSPSLLMGLFIAGLIHVYLPPGLIHRGLNQPNMASVTRASLLGVPLPLCSCGVIPTALGLRKEGASPGATTAFMISTPQTGVDSILVSAAFLGWPFALFKLVAAFVTGLAGGALVNRFVPADPAAGRVRRPLRRPGTLREHGLIGALRYAVFDLLAAIDLWLIGGVLAGRAGDHPDAAGLLRGAGLGAGTGWNARGAGDLAAALCLHHGVGADRRIADRRGHARRLGAGVPDGGSSYQCRHHRCRVPHPRRRGCSPCTSVPSWS